MVNIKVSELKKFISAAKHIKDTRILPIYAYVKLSFDKSKSTLYKSNGHSFVTCPVESESKNSGVFIIEETALYGFIDYCSSGVVSFKKNKDRIEISDGSKVVACSSIDDNYPVIQGKEDGDSYSFDGDVIDAIYSAKAHTLPASDKTVRPWNCFVHISRVGKFDYVAGFNGFTSYIQKFKTKLPNIVLDPDTIMVISRLGDVTYSSGGNYDFFDSNGITYGFIKPENKVADLSTVIDNFANRVKSFSVQKKNIVDFCEMILSINNTAVQPEIILEDLLDEDKVLMSYEGVAGQSAADTVSIKKDSPFGRKIFNPKNVIVTMKELPFDEVTISILGENMILSSTEEPNYLGSIMSLATI